MYLFHRHTISRRRGTQPRQTAGLFAQSLLLAWLLLGAGAAIGQPFRFPTANHALLEQNGLGQFFVPTVGKTWESGSFGCVRSGGSQMHEGIDIRGVNQDRKGEPLDPVMAVSDGVVAYCNAHSGLSNYGKYVVLRHQIEGVEIYSLYAHLSEIRSGLQPGRTLKAGEPLGIMGRTSNTKDRISKDRAHLHLEFDFFVNDRFAQWFKAANPGERNDHGNYNGLNLVAIDPGLIFLQERQLGARFSLLQFMRNQTELCRVVVRKTDFPWVRRHPELVRRNPLAERQGIAGYEIALNFNGVAFELIPRSAGEIRGPGRFQLLSVNEAEERKNHARQLVTQKRGRWELAPHGIQCLEMLVY